MLPALAVMLFVPGAPVPKQNFAALQAAFGTVPESDDFNAKFTQGRLTLVSKGKAFRSFYDDGRLVAPRTERNLSGDFTVEVTLHATSRPKQTVPKQDARVQSGLYIRCETEVVRVGRFVRVATSDDGKKTIHDESLWVEYNGAGSRIVECAHDDRVEVRMVKTAEKIQGFVRRDSGEWSHSFTRATRMGADVTVGVALLPEVDQEASATFEDFKVLRK